MFRQSCNLQSVPPDISSTLLAQLIVITILFFKYFIYLFVFREREREGEREGEKHRCVVASRMPPTGDLACNPGMSPKLGIKPTTL